MVAPVHYIFQPCKISTFIATGKQKPEISGPPSDFYDVDSRLFSTRVPVILWPCVAEIVVVGIIQRVVL